MVGERMAGPRMGRRKDQFYQRMTPPICPLPGTWRGPHTLGKLINILLTPKEDFQTLLGLFTALSLSVNHVYTTETLGKEQRTLCKGFTYKNFKHTPVRWDKCQAKSGKLMFVANHTIVDWGPHGMWLSIGRNICNSDKTKNVKKILSTKYIFMVTSRVQGRGTS